MSEPLVYDDLVIQERDFLRAEVLGLCRHIETILRKTGALACEVEVAMNITQGVSRFTTRGDGWETNVEGPEPITLSAHVEQIDDGYDVGKDGAHWRRYKAGAVFYVVTVGGEVAFVSSRKPDRVAVDLKNVVYTWGRA